MPRRHIRRDGGTHGQREGHHWGLQRRRCRWTIGGILGAGTLLLLPSAGSADPAAGSSWDHHHMRSNATGQWTAVEARRIVIGTAATSTSIGVVEQTLHISQQGWEPGGPKTFATSARPTTFSG